MAVQALSRFFKRNRDATRPLPTAAPSIPLGRLTKLAASIALLTVAGLTMYQQLIVRVSREAVINARIVSIRAPIDGVVKAGANAPGAGVTAGTPIGEVDDPTVDDSRVFQLQTEVQATEREREAASRNLIDLQRARSQAEAQADAYRVGRVRQVELRIEEARAGLAAAKAKEAEAIGAERRGNSLRGNGYMAQATYDNLVHARDAAQQQTVAAQKRVDTLAVELDSARNGTYLGDNYNDVPSSVQRARELAVRIDETKATLDQLQQKGNSLAAQLAAERNRLQMRRTAALISPINGNLWTVQARQPANTCARVRNSLRCSTARPLS